MEKKEQKKYTIAGTEFELAPVTNVRMGKYCDLLGITDFHLLNEPGMEKEMGARLMNLTMKTENIETILKTCLADSGEIGVIDLSEIDLALVDTIFNDFFSQRLKRF